MAHDLTSIARVVADNAPAPDQSSGIVYAIIAATGLVLAATLPVLISRWNRTEARPHPHPVPLNSDTAANGGHPDVKAARIAALERFCYRHHFDPTKISTGEEPTADVHFD